MQNVEREQLEQLTVKVLIKDYATPLNITGRHDMKKGELIDAVLDAYNSQTVNEPTKEEVETTDNEIGNVHDVPEVKEEGEENPFAGKVKRKELTDIQKANKRRYVEEADIGTIVAFKLPGMKVKSAKIIRKSTKNKKFKVETTYGTEFVIDFDNVIWVKTNKRWPKGVYNLLKGIGDE